MTIFAVMTAGLFPLIHAGRMWFAYWLLPYPNQRYLWPNFKSPLVWDVFAISTYLTISAVFFIVGLVPDIAALRDASTGWRRRIYAMLSLGWEGSDRQWRHYRRAYGLFAALATPLVLSVHSVVSWDFAMALVPGWHSTLFAPVLRRRRHLLRLRDGAGARAADAALLQPATPTSRTGTWTRWPS